MTDAGHEAAAFGAELRDEEATRAMIDRVRRHFGRLDALVNNAAIWSPTPLDTVGADDVRRFFEVNTLSTFICCQHAGLIMAQQETGGAIVNIGDWAVARPYRNYSAYFVSKGAIPTMTRLLAVELAPRVRVNAVLPGPVLLPEGVSEAERHRAISGTLLGRPGRPENVAQAVAPCWKTTSSPACACPSTAAARSAKRLELLRNANVAVAPRVGAFIMPTNVLTIGDMQHRKLKDEQITTHFALIPVSLALLSCGWRPGCGNSSLPAASQQTGSGENQARANLEQAAASIVAATKESVAAATSNEQAVNRPHMSIESLRLIGLMGEFDTAPQTEELLDDLQSAARPAVAESIIQMRLARKLRQWNRLDASARGEAIERFVADVKKHGLTAGTGGAGHPRLGHARRCERQQAGFQGD